MLTRFRREDSIDAMARRLHQAAVTRARSPLFHRQLKVPDTIDGRFDLLTLHLYIVMDALRSEGVAGTALSEALVTQAFARFEDALRDLGVSDFGLSRRIKAMANAFYGRLDAYALGQDDPMQLAPSVMRNLYRGEAARDAEAAAIARYILSARARLKSNVSALLAGSVDFGPLPEL